jgi:hypothetical protein
MQILTDNSDELTVYPASKMFTWDSIGHGSSFQREYEYVVDGDKIFIRLLTHDEESSSPRAVNGRHVDKGRLTDVGKKGIEETAEFWKENKDPVLRERHSKRDLLVEAERELRWHEAGRDIRLALIQAGVLDGQQKKELSNR